MAAWRIWSACFFVVMGGLTWFGTHARPKQPESMGIESPTDPAKASLTFEGRVLTDDGSVLPNARVTLMPVPDRASRLRAWLDGIRPAPVSQTQTDAEGYFRVEGQGEALFRLEVVAEGRPTLSQLVGPAEAGLLEPMHLATGEVLAVRVLDEGGRPLKDTLLQLEILPFGGFRPPALLAAETRTDSDGWGRIVRPPSVMNFLLSVRAAGHPPRRIDVASRTTLFDVQFSVGRRVEVSVNDEEGRPATALLLDESGLPLAMADEGRATVIVGGHTRQLRAVDAEGRHAHQSLPLEADAIRLQLAAPKRLSGKVIDSVTRRPIAQAWVYQLGEAPDLTRSDRAGEFRLNLAPTAQNTLIAAAPGYWSRIVTDVDNNSPEPTLALDPSAELTGSVVDSDGRPVAGAQLLLSVPDNRQEIPPVWQSAQAFRIPETWSDAQGTFHFSRAMIDLPLRLDGLKSALAPGRLEVTPLVAGELRGGLVLTLPEGTTVFGQVIDMSQRPIAGATIQIERQVSLQSEPRLAVTTDSHGRFHLQGIAAGRFDLKITAVGFAPLRVPGVVSQEGPVEQDLGTLELTPSLELSGSIVDPAGRPLAGATIAYSPQALWLGGPTQNQVTADSKGRFIIGGLAIGDQVAMKVSLHGYIQTSVLSAAAPLTEPLQLTLTPSAVLKGRVVDSAGHAVTRANVRVRPEHVGGSGAPVPRTTDETGRFLFDDLEPGLYRLTIAAEEFQEHEISGVEASDGAENIEILMDRGGVVEGKVLGPEGEPLVGLMVHVSRKGSNYSRGTGSDQSGRFRLGGLAQGDFQVSVEHPTLGSVAEAVLLTGSDPARVELRFPAELGVTKATVSGRVLDADSSPLAGAIIRLHAVGRSGGWHPFREDVVDQVSSGEEGAFEFSKVIPGIYNLSAEKSRLVPATLQEPMRVDGEPVMVPDLRLRRGCTVHGIVRGVDLDDLARVRVTGNQGRRSMGATQVDHEGRFSFEGLAPGIFQLAVQLTHRGLERFTSLKLREGQLETQIEIDLGSARSSLSGRVRLDDKAMSGAVIFVRIEDFQGQATTDADGAYRIERLPTGLAELSLIGPVGSISMDTNFEIEGNATYDFDLHSVLLTGRVVDAKSREGIAGASLEWADGQVNSDSRGHFVLSTLAANFPLKLNVRFGGYALYERKLVLPPEHVVEELEIALQPAVSLVFAVATPTGTASSISACLDSPDGKRLSCGQLAADPAGLFRMDVGERGRYTLILQADNTVVSSFKVSAPATARIPLHLSMGGQVDLRVSGVASGKVGRLKLWTSDGNPYYNLGRHGFARASNGFVVGDGPLRLPAGVVHLELVIDQVTYHGQVDVIEGETVEVELRSLGGPARRRDPG